MRDLTRTRLCDPLGHNAWQQRTGELVKGGELPSTTYRSVRASVVVRASRRDYGLRLGRNADVSA